MDDVRAQMGGETLAGVFDDLIAEMTRRWDALSPEGHDVYEAQSEARRRLAWDEQECKQVERTNWIASLGRET